MFVPSKLVKTVNTLKSRYTKYLENLCIANGLNIASLKNDGAQVEKLEMYFGGMPALIGMKYFTSLTILRIFEQDITNVKSLIEVASTLDELWICEGQLKDLSGIENCKRLRKLFLYDNQIEDASPLSQLYALETLCLMNNSIDNLTFVNDLPLLTVLKISANHLDDAAFTSVYRWPRKLHTLDISDNHVTNLKSLFTLVNCEALCDLSLWNEMYELNEAVRYESCVIWIAYHFRFIERLDDDRINEKFFSNYTTIGETKFLEVLNNELKLRSEFLKKAAIIENNRNRIVDRLEQVDASLNTLKGTNTTKDARKDVIRGISSDVRRNLKSVSHIAKEATKAERIINEMETYLLCAVQLESASTMVICSPSENEKKLIEKALMASFSLSNHFDIFVKWAKLFVDKIEFADTERIFLIDRDQNSRVWCVRDAIRLIDRFNDVQYRADPIRVYKDLSLMRNEAGEKKHILVVPIVFCEKLSKKFYRAISNEKTITASKPVDNNDDIVDSDQQIAQESANPDEGDDRLLWADLQLAAICIVEVASTSALNTNDMLIFDQFVKKLELQLARLRGMNIDLKLESKPNRAHIDTSHVAKNEHEPKMDSPKERKVSDLLDANSLQNRWNKESYFSNSKIFSTRDPLSLILAYMPNPIFVDVVDFQASVTTLDLSECKLTKLDGIENLLNLNYLSVSRNKLNSLKKIASLNCLIFLDASENIISKIDLLPQSLSMINLRSNAIISLNFCENLQLVTKLDISMNRIRSLRGIGNMKLLEILLCAKNQLKEKGEIAILKNFPNLLLLDFSGNSLKDINGYKQKVLLNCPSLQFLDVERIPNEERIAATKTPGKALTAEFMDRWIPNLSAVKTIAFPNQRFETVLYDDSILSRMKHIKEINLSKNRLKHFYDLIRLENLHTLDLSENSIIAIANEPIGNDQVMPNLEVLILRSNGITYGILEKMRLQLLQSLKILDLSSNAITRFDGRVFDLPHLEEINLSHNQIKSVKRRTLQNLKRLNLANNYLKDIGLFHLPSIELLNLAANKIATCAALKSLILMKCLRSLNCKDNPVTQRRVYVEYVRSQVKSLEELDGEAVAKSDKRMPEVRNPPPRQQHYIEIGNDEEDYYTHPYHAQFRTDMESTNLLKSTKRAFVVERLSSGHLHHTMNITHREQPTNALYLSGVKIIKHQKL